LSLLLLLLQMFTHPTIISMPSEQMKLYVNAQKTIITSSKEQDEIEHAILMLLCTSDGNLTENESAVATLMGNKKRFLDNISDISRAKTVLNTTNNSVQYLAGSVFHC
jgi:hypothetical protein